MRTLLIGMAGSLVVLVVLAGAANASATVDLLWIGKNGSPAGSGAVTTSVSSDTLTLGIFVTAGPNDVSSIGISVDYSSGTFGNFAVVGFSNAPNGLAPFAFTVGSISDTGTRISNYNASAFGGALVSGATYQAGTLQLHQVGPATGTFTVAPVIIGAPISTDMISDGASNNISGTSTFNGAAIVNASTPEPGTALLLGLGLCGLTVASRRRRS